MAYARMASRLKLFGLLLICTSVLVFLVLSACGVDSVHVNTPLAKRLATRWQLTSPPVEPPIAAAPAADTSLSAAPAVASSLAPPPQYAAAPAGEYAVLPPGYTLGPFNTAGQYPPRQTAGLSGESAYAAQATPAPLFTATGLAGPRAGSTSATGANAVESAAATDVGLRIPLWCINAVFLAIGFVLWSMPQPRPSAYPAGRRH